MSDYLAISHCHPLTREFLKTFSELPFECDLALSFSDVHDDPLASRGWIGVARPYLDAGSPCVRLMSASTRMILGFPPKNPLNAERRKNLLRWAAYSSYMTLGRPKTDQSRLSLLALRRAKRLV